MTTLDIMGFWRARLQGSAVGGASGLAGWIADAAAPEGFVEPTLNVLEGDPATARMIVVAAPGALGKSSYAAALAEYTRSVVVNLALTSQLGGNFFTGGIRKALGSSALEDAEAGKIALIVDALDEAQMRAGPEGYGAALDDLADIAGKTHALPAVLLGRAIAAEDAYLYLATKGHDVALLEIQFFDEDQANHYIERKLPMLAARNEQFATAYATHPQPYGDLARAARARLIETAGADQDRFAGYAPVLDAICAFTLQDGCFNPKSRIEELSASSPIELIRDINASILLREQIKVQDQFKQRHRDVTTVVLADIYTPDEQLARIASRLLGTRPPELPMLPGHDFNSTYREMVEQFAPQHPFVSPVRTSSNPIFTSYVLAWALGQPDKVDVARRSALEQPALMSPILFELYDCELERERPHVPLADVGILYQALNAQITPGQRVQLEILSDEDDDGQIDVYFEILERENSESGEPLEGVCWGPYSTTSTTSLELRSPFSNIYIDAPIVVQLGDGVVQQIAAPTELNVEWLCISAKQVLVTSAGAPAAGENQTVSLIARAVECDGVLAVDVKEGASLSVCWENAETYPWNEYAATIVPPFSEDVDFMRRRLRNILTAFRSHSKGALRRLAAKINHSRMIKDERGATLVRRLIADKVLVPVQSGKFYELDSGVMGALLGVAYNDLARSRFTPELDSYLLDVLNDIKAGGDAENRTTRLVQA